MHGFLLRENISHFRNFLTREKDEKTRRTVYELLAVAERELAVFEAQSFGTESEFGPRALASSASRRNFLADFQASFEDSPHPYLLIDPRPGLHILDVNNAYASATMIARDKVAGQSLFGVFPDNPELPEADGVRNLYASLRLAATKRRPHTMLVQRYDVRDPDGRFVERYWRPINTPILDNEGEIVCLLHHVEDVTEDFRSGLEASDPLGR